SLGLLNAVQAMVIALAVSLLMWRAATGIVAGRLTLGDLVMVNALLIQLYIPLNFLGVMYREIKQAITDMEKMFRLLAENREVADKPSARALAVAGGAIRFEHVAFSYDGVPPILKDVSFEVRAGSSVAVCGARAPNRAFQRAAAGEMGDDGGRTAPQALGRREAARLHRAHASQEPADPHLRRGDLGPRLAHRKIHSSRARRDLARPHHARHRAPPLDDRRCRRDPRPRPRRDRRARPLPRPPRRERPLRRDVAIAAGRRTQGGRGVRAAAGPRLKRSRAGLGEERAQRPEHLARRLAHHRVAGVERDERRARNLRGEGLPRLEARHLVAPAGEDENRDPQR